MVVSQDPVPIAVPSGDTFTKRLLCAIFFRCINLGFRFNYEYDEGIFLWPFMVKCSTRWWFWRRVYKGQTDTRITKIVRGVNKWYCLDYGTIYIVLEPQFIQSAESIWGSFSLTAFWFGVSWIVLMRWLKTYFQSRDSIFVPVQNLLLLCYFWFGCSVYIANCHHYWHAMHAGNVTVILSHLRASQRLTV